MDYVKEITDLKSFLEDHGLILDYNKENSVHIAILYLCISGREDIVQVTGFQSSDPKKVWEHLLETLSGTTYFYSYPSDGIEEAGFDFPEFTTVEELREKLKNNKKK